MSDRLLLLWSYLVVKLSSVVHSKHHNQLINIKHDRNQYLKMAMADVTGIKGTIFRTYCRALLSVSQATLSYRSSRLVLLSEMRSDSVRAARYPQVPESGAILRRLRAESFARFSKSDVWYRLPFACKSASFETKGNTYLATASDSRRISAICLYFSSFPNFPKYRWCTHKTTRNAKLH